MQRESLTAQRTQIKHENEKGISEYGSPLASAAHHVDQEGLDVKAASDHMFEDE